MSDYEDFEVQPDELIVLQSLENELGTRIYKASVQRIEADTKNNLFSLDASNHINALRMVSAVSMEESLGHIPHGICSLKYLEKLYIIGQNISDIPKSISNLSKLIVINLWSNPVEYIPHFLIEMENLKAFFLSGFNSVLPYINLLPYLKSVKFDRKLEIGKLWRVIENQD